MSEASSLVGAPVRRTGGRGRVAVAVAALIVALALIVIGIGMIFGAGRSAPAALRDVEGNAVQFDPGSAPSAEQEAAIDAAPYGDARFVVPSAGLDVSLNAMNVVDGEIMPPTFDGAYWVRNLGVAPDDAAAGTVYVAMHALRNGAVGPGNYLIDIDAARSRLVPGELVHVGDLVYAVTGSTVIARDEIASAADVWADQPGRLVILTCLQRPDNRPAVANVVITAELVDGEGPDE